MIKVALLVRLEAKSGKEAEVEAFLRAGLALVQQEPATAVWFAIRLGPSTFGIFDAFPDDSGRQAHLAGQGSRSTDGEGLPIAGSTPGYREGRRACGQAT